MFRGSVKSTGYPLHSPFFPFTSPSVRHRIPSHFNWTLQQLFAACGGSMCKYQLDAKIPASTHARYSSGVTWRSLDGAGKPTAVWISKTSQPNTANVPATLSGTAKPCHITLLRCGRMLKSGRSLTDKSLVSPVCQSKNDSDLNPSSVFP